MADRNARPRNGFSRAGAGEVRYDGQWKVWSRVGRLCAARLWPRALTTVSSGLVSRG